MNNDVIKAIAQAETQAAAIIEQAQSAAKDTVAKAHTQADAAKAVLLDEARAAAHDIQADAEAEGRKKADEILRENAGECAALKSAALGRVDIARDAILERIVS